LVVVVEALFLGVPVVSMVSICLFMLTGGCRFD